MHKLLQIQKYVMNYSIEHAQTKKRTQVLFFDLKAFEIMLMWVENVYQKPNSLTQAVDLTNQRFYTRSRTVRCTRLDFHEHHEGLIPCHQKEQTLLTRANPRKPCSLRRALDVNSTVLNPYFK